jgi:glycerate dehydrogenase
VRIVVLDGRTLNPGDNPWDPVASLGTLEVYDRTGRDDVVARAEGAEVVITNKTVLRSEALVRLDRLRLIAVLATGYDNVDLEAARARGVTVCNVPAYATDSVAQHAFAFAARAVPARGRARRGDTPWGMAAAAGVLLLVVGARRVERARDGDRRPRAHRTAHRGAGACVRHGRRGMVRSKTAAASPPFVRLVALDELFSLSDVVRFIARLTPETERLVDAARLASMKPTAFLVNTARGRLIDEAALAAALSEGRLAGAALDTVSREPIADEDPLLAAPNCILTSHMAWASLAARRRLMLATADNIRAFLAGRPTNVVS